MTSLEADLEKNLPDFFGKNVPLKDRLASRSERSLRASGTPFQKFLFDLHKRKILLALVVLAFTGLSNPSFTQSDDLMVSESHLLQHHLDDTSTEEDPGHKPQRELYHFPRTEPSMLRKPPSTALSTDIEDEQNLDPISEDEIPLESLDLRNISDASESNQTSQELQSEGDRWKIPEDSAVEAEQNDSSAGMGNVSSITMSLGSSPELEGIDREVQPVMHADDGRKYYALELYIQCDDEPENIGFTIYDMRRNEFLSKKSSLVDTRKVYVLPLPTGQYMVEVTDREGTSAGNGTKRYELWVNKVKLVEGADFRYTSGVIEFKLFRNGSRKLVSHTQTG